MTERVRAAVVTTGGLLVIRRDRPGMAPYRVLPGGHVEAGDASLEDALRRELREELGADATILRLVDVIRGEDGRSTFFLAATERWSFAGRTGPEFSEPGRGSYALEAVAARAGAVESIGLKPAGFAAFLARALRAPGGLAALPDLREAGPAA